MRSVVFSSPVVWFRTGRRVGRREIVMCLRTRSYAAYSTPLVCRCNLFPNNPCTFGLPLIRYRRDGVSATSGGWCKTPQVAGFFCCVELYVTILRRSLTSLRYKNRSQSPANICNVEAGTGRSGDGRNVPPIGGTDEVVFLSARIYRSP